MNRHIFIYSVPYAREKILNTAQKENPAIPTQYLQDILNPEVPFIVKRQESLQGDNAIETGFSSWQRLDGQRINCACTIAAKEIERTISNYNILQHVHPRYEDKAELIPLIKKLQSLAEYYKLALGLYGSTALALLTALPYRHRHSDIDILIKPSKPCSNLEDFYRQTLQFEADTGIRLDIELQTPKNFGIKLKELFSEQKTVLAKGLYSVEIIPKKQWEALL